MKFLVCLDLAQRIVQAYRDEAPPGFDPQGFDVGGTDSSGSTKFSRTGTSETQKDYTLPSDLAALIQQAYLGSQITPATTSSEQNLLQTILSGSLDSIPGLSALQGIWGIDPVNYSGLSSLMAMSQRNPYSTDYETGVGALFDRQFGKGRALAQSGPMNVRGGTARQGFELGEADAQNSMNKFREVRGQQDREAGVVQDAVRTMNTIEGMRRGSAMQAQQQNMAGELGRKSAALNAQSGVDSMRRSNAGNIGLAAEFLGRPKQRVTDDLKGRGSQSASSSNWGAGITCCFIFLQALNGQLPDYVRKGRDKFNTPNRQAGYRWMSSWLVPMMARSRLILSIVNFFIIRPFLIVGRWHFGKEESWTDGIIGPLLKPYCFGWFYTWSTLGVIYGKLSRHPSISAV